ncbi:MAG TPA: hypothetical protein VGR60_09170 [Gemmatimonadales bacterium]|nr:hypothetical protein [Gemmatimonadales bacterium]
MFARTLLFAIVLAGPAAAQLPMRTLGSHGDQIIQIRGDSLAPLDSIPPDEALPRFKSCGAPRPALGAMRGSGTVTYTLLADGTVDTSSVTAVEARGMSFPGVTSAATRVLGQCRFKPARLGRHPVPIRLAQIMKFNTVSPRLPSFVSSIRDTRSEGATTSMARLGFGTDTTAVIYMENSRDLDEVPLMQYCSIPSLPGSLRSASANLLFVIGPDGSVDSAAVRVTISSTSATAPMTEAVFVTLATRCHYAPARVLGRPVSMVVQQTITVRDQ